MENLMAISQEQYQELVRRAAHDPDWAMYLLLINACLEVLRGLPESGTNADIEELTAQTLDRFGDGIAQCLRGGWREFRNYMPEGRHNVRI